MVREEVRRIPITLGHVAVYARDGRWRRALACSVWQSPHPEGLSSAAKTRDLHAESADCAAAAGGDDDEAQ